MIYISELKEMGLPVERIKEACRCGKIGIKSDPDAERGYHFLITLDEALLAAGYRRAQINDTMRENN